MFIKKDLRKVPEILVDPDDPRVALKLSRRAPEFGGTLAALCRPLMQDAAPVAQVRRLTLYGNELTSVEGISAFAASPLDDLNLGDNRLTELPEEFAKLRGLTSLWLDDNQFGALPEVVLTLPLLERLVMPRNALARLPRGLSAHLPMLKELVLDNNCLAELPEDLGDLARLEMLSVRGNRLKQLPASVGSLTALKWLAVSSNLLKALPPALGLLTSLERLLANGNRLERLPPELARLARLKLVNLANNKLTVLPPELQHWGVEGGCATQVELQGNPLAGAGAELTESQFSQSMLSAVKKAKR